MWLIRLMEETIAVRYSEQKMRCPVHLSTGQEAVSAAIGLAMKETDFAVSTHRSHGHYIGKNGNLNKMVAELYGKETGCSNGKGGSMHLIDQSIGFMGSTAIVGNSIPVGAGFGLSIKLNQTDQISCIFIGDAAIEEGVFAETVNFVALKQLPVLFVCENNYYSVYSSLKVRQPEGRSIFEMANSMGIPSSKGDGNNVEEVYELAIKSIEKIRSGKGPIFLEFTTYRWREHCGPNYDNDIGYREETEFLKWKQRDPISKYVQELQNININKEQLNQIHEKAKMNVQNAFEFAEASPFPDKSATFQNIYA